MWAADGAIGVYSLEELARRWYTQDVTPEQAIGQMLQILQDMEQRLKRLEEKGKIGGVPVGTPRR